MEIRTDTLSISTNKKYVQAGMEIKGKRKRKDVLDPQDGGWLLGKRLLDNGVIAIRTGRHGDQGEAEEEGRT